MAYGKGTVDSPFLIGSVADIEVMRNNPKSYFRMIRDITFEVDHVPFDFSGIFDGDGHKLLGLRYDVSTGADIPGGFISTSGLVGGARGGNTEYKNLTIDIKPNGCIGKASKYNGALMGESYGSVSLVNVVIDGGKIISGGDRAGTLVGYLDMAQESPYDRFLLNMNNVFIGGGVDNAGQRVGHIGGYLYNGLGGNANARNVYWCNTGINNAWGSGDTDPSGTQIYNITDWGDQTKYPTLDWDRWEIYNGAPRQKLARNAYDGTIKGDLTLKGEILNGAVVVLLDEFDQFVDIQAASGNSFEFNNLDKTGSYSIIVKEPSGEWEHRIRSRIKPL